MLDHSKRDGYIAPDVRAIPRSATSPLAPPDERYTTGRPLHIAVVTSIARTLDAFFVEWLEAWQEAGLRVTTISSGRPSKGLVPHVEIRSLSQRPGLATLRAVHDIRHALSNIRPDIVLTSTATASGVVRLAGSASPIVYFAHGLHWSGSRSLSGFGWKVLERLLLQRTSAFIAINSDDARWLREQTSPDRVLNLRGGVGLDLHYWSDIDRDPIPGRVLVVGAIDPRKQPLEAVYVFGHLLSRIPDATLAFVGEGTLKAEASSLATKLGFRDRITFQGHTPNVQNELAVADVVFHAARWEGLPRALLEARASRVPVVAYDAKGTRDVPGVHLVPNGNRSAAADALAKVITSSDVGGGPVLGDEYDSYFCAMTAIRFLRGWTSRP